LNHSYIKFLVYAFFVPELGHSLNQQQNYYKRIRSSPFWKTIVKLKKVKQLIIRRLKNKNGNFPNSFRYEVFQKV